MLMKLIKQKNQKYILLCVYTGPKSFLYISILLKYAVHSQHIQLLNIYIPGAHRRRWRRIPCHSTVAAYNDLILIYDYLIFIYLVRTADVSDAGGRFRAIALSRHVNPAVGRKAHTERAPKEQAHVISPEICFPPQKSAPSYVCSKESLSHAE
jgi:hypothetical protein